MQHQITHINQVPIEEKLPRGFSHVAARLPTNSQSRRFQPAGDLLPWQLKLLLRVNGSRRHSSADEGVGCTQNFFVLSHFMSVEKLSFTQLVKKGHRIRYRTINRQPLPSKGIARYT